MRKIQLIFLFIFISATGAAHASPGYSFVCFNKEITATIDLDLAWQTAYLSINQQEVELTANDAQSGPDGFFNFGSNNYRFSGVAPEGQIMRGDKVIARCYQSRESIKNIALYNTDANGKWSKYNARGQGFQTVRSSPSVFGEKLDSLNQGEPVTILENTDQFLDGFFWFKIEYGKRQQGYMWGALLCTNADNPELNSILRRCN